MFHGYGTLHYRSGVTILTKWNKGEITSQGVKTFPDGTKVRFTKIDDQTVFEKRIVFPMKDYRLEYKGAVKECNIMHGHGTLTFKGGLKVSEYFKDGEATKRKIEFAGVKAGWNIFIKKQEKIV